MQSIDDPALQSRRIDRVGGEIHEHHENARRVEARIGCL